MDEVLDAAKYLRARNLRTVRVGRDMPGSNWHMHQLDVMVAFDTTVTGLQPTQQLKRSLIAESVEVALRRAHAPAHHRTEIAPPCRTITRL